MPNTFQLLPNIWRRLDTNGTLERFLGIWDDNYDDISVKISELLDIQNPNKTQDRHLRLLGGNIGHIWRDDKTYAWNRNRIRDALRRYSYKGTNNQLSDTIEENGAEINKIQDNASMIMVLDKQGNLDGRNCHLQDADRWHDGVFEIDMNKVGDTSELSTELADIRPAGFTWMLSYSIVIAPIEESPEIDILDESDIEYHRSIWSTDVFNDGLDLARVDGNAWLGFESDRADRTIQISTTGHSLYYTSAIETGLDFGRLDGNASLDFDSGRNDTTFDIYVSGHTIYHTTEEITGTDSGTLDGTMFLSFESDHADYTIDITTE